MMTRAEPPAGGPDVQDRAGLDAEYVALTQLHADALITLNPPMTTAAKDLVTLAPVVVT